jgi:hypothetical protein
MQDHSYGDSSGITPDSLLIRPEAEPIVDANVREVLVKSKMKRERSIMQKYHCIFSSTDPRQVYRVYGTEDSVIDIDRKYSRVFVPYPAIADELPLTGSYPMQNPDALMQIDYFLKQSYNGTNYPPFLIPDPVTRPSRWEGTGYYSIRYPDDTLCFKYPVNYYPDDTLGKHPRYYYANRMSVPYYMTNLSEKLDFFCSPQLSFQLLTIGYATFEHHATDGCYIVVKK